MHHYKILVDSLKMMSHSGLCQVAQTLVVLNGEVEAEFECRLGGLPIAYSILSGRHGTGGRGE